MTKASVPLRVGLLAFVVLAVLAVIGLAGHGLALAAPDAVGVGLTPSSDAKCSR